MKRIYHVLSIAMLIFILPMFMFAQQAIMDRNSPSSIRFEEGNQPTVSTFFQEFRQDFPMSEDNQMVVLQTNTDKAGTHHRYDQYYKGVQIIGAQYVLHEKNGSVWFANGRLIHGLDMDVSPKLKEQSALSAALQEINADVYMWESASNEEMIKSIQKDDHATFRPRGKLMLTSGSNDLTSTNIKLVYRFDVFAEEPLSRNWVDVDAKTGEIVNKTSQLHEGDVPGTGSSLYNGTVNMTVDELSPTSFILHESTTRGAEIHTYDMQNGSSTGSAVEIESLTADGPWDGVGVSAHWGAESTYDYYMDKFGRNSLDDAGFPLNSYVHYQTNLNNAYWTGTHMLYGDGDGVNFNPLVSLDVVGHELTHGVTNFTSNLIYANESGGLNESFSDIFGNLVEFEVEGYDPEIWRIGEDFAVNNLGFRNMANPNEFNNPDCYEGDFWFYNEVHNTSGVQNFWFYLLVEGGSGTNDVGFSYNVTGIGMDDAGAIAYMNNTSFLIPSSNYDDARIGSIAAAESLFGVGSPQAISTADAWDAVNVDGVQPPPPPAPDNDLCTDAVALSCENTVSGTTIGATFDGDATYCDFPHDAGGVWYTVEGNGNTMTATMCGGPVYDARITVYEGSCESLVCVGADDDGCGGYGNVSTFSWLSNEGTTYYILVHGWGGYTGDFELTILTDAPPAIAVTPSEISMVVPLEDSDSDQVTISNTEDGCVSNLNWTIVKSEPAPLFNKINAGSVESKDLNTNQDSKKSIDISYLISEQTIKDLDQNGFFDEYKLRSQLTSLQGQTFSDKTELYQGLLNAIGEQNRNSISIIGPSIEIIDNNSTNDGISYARVNKGHQPPAGSPVFLSGTAQSSTSRGLATTTTLTHSQSQSRIDGNSVACWYGGPTTQNSYWRSFDLFNFGISSDFDVTEVEIGVQLSFEGIGTQTVTVNLYTSDGGAFPTGTLSFIGTATYTVPDQSLTMLSLPVSGTATAGSELVVEISSPDGLANSSGFYIGSNNLGQTAPSYLSAPECGIVTPTDLADLEFPGMHILMNVTGEYDDPCSWLSASPYFGSTPEGSSDDVNVNLDAAGLPIGTYACQLTVMSNASNESSVVVPVKMIVGTPLERIDQLIAKVEALKDAGVLNKGQANALISKLKSAKKSINMGNNNAAINKLNAFINQVNAFMNAGILTEEEGGELIADAEEIIAILESGSSYKSDLTLFGDADETGSIYDLQQNYPNPFNGITTISFTLSESNFTTLKVYNAMGQEVAVLFNEEAHSDQRYAVEFQGNHIPEGIYYYHLKSGDGINTMKKMMHIK